MGKKDFGFDIEKYKKSKANLETIEKDLYNNVKKVCELLTTLNSKSTNDLSVGPWSGTNATIFMKQGIKNYNNTLLKAIDDLEYMIRLTDETIKYSK